MDHFLSLVFGISTDELTITKRVVVIVVDDVDAFKCSLKKSRALRSSLFNFYLRVLRDYIPYLHFIY